MPIQVNPINPLQSKVDDLDAQELEMTTRAQEVVAEQNASKPKAADKPEVDAKTKKKNKEFRQRIDSTKTYRRKLITNWTTSIDYRRGKPFTSQTDEDQIAVNYDWTLTKAKCAALFSQIPKARIDHGGDTTPKAAPWAQTFESKLNDTLVSSGIEATMEETLPDCVNAAGLGIAMVSMETLTEDKDIPLSEDDPEGETTTIPYPVDKRYVVERISPSDFLWPLGFKGSNFDNAAWIGRSDRITWESAVHRFGLTEEDKAKALGEEKPMLDKLSHDTERDKTQADQYVEFDEIFYKEYQYSPDSKSFNTIHHLVFVSGKEDPVIDEPWQGQKIGPDGKVLGAQRYPIRVLTISYITDEAIPPSDSAVGRPQVNELNKIRTLNILQRQRSLPVRWVDLNRVDPAILQSLMRGTWQSFIPVQGEGSRVIGEVARAQMPNENFMFDKIAKGDLLEEWVGGETGVLGQDAEGEPNQNKRPFNTQIGKDRARVASFFTSIAEVLGGLMCLFEDPKTLGEGFDPQVSELLRCSILADSTVLIDVSQKIEQLDQFINLYGKTGWINLEPIMQERAALTGLDPAKVVQAPSPKPPAEPNISLRLTGVEDMLNPMALAFLINSGQAPKAEQIEQAKLLIQQAVVPPQPPPGQEQGPQVGPDGQPLPPGTQAPGAPLAPPQGAPPPGTPQQQPPPPKPGEANPDMAAMPQIMKRSEGSK